jgi:ubiquitin C-terminal hydrolase
MIWHIPRGAGNSRKKESLLLNLLRCDWLVRFSIEQDVDRARVRTKHTNLQIVTNAVRTQDAKRIGMCPTDEAAHLVTGHSGNLEGFHTFSRTFEADNGKVTDYRINAKVSFDLETEG